MNNTYKWTIGELEAIPSINGLSNVIQQVNWSYEATDANNNTATQSGTVLLDMPSEENFIPSENLKKENIIQWLESKIDLIAIKRGLDFELAAIANGPYVSITLSE